MMNRISWTKRETDEFLISHIIWMNEENFIEAQKIFLIFFKGTFSVKSD